MKIIVGAPLICFSLVFIYLLFFAKPVYTSTSKIMSSSINSSGSGVSGLAAEFGFQISNNQSEPKWVYSEILESRSLAQAVLKSYFDSGNTAIKKTFLDILIPKSIDRKLNEINREKKAIGILQSMLEVKENIKTGIYTVKIHAPNPRLSIQLNKAYIEVLDNHQRSYNKTKSSETRIFIENRIKDTEKELIAVEENLKIFMDRNRRIQNSPSLILDQQRLSREVAVMTEVFTTLKQQLETSKIEEVKDSDYVIVIDSPDFSLIKTKPNRLMMIFVSLFFGLSAGILIGFISEYFAQSDEVDKLKIQEARLIMKKILGNLFSSFYKKSL